MHREKPVKMIGKLKETHFQCSPNCYFYVVFSMCLNTEQWAHLTGIKTGRNPGGSARGVVWGCWARPGRWQEPLGQSSPKGTTSSLGFSRAQSSHLAPGASSPGAFLWVARGLRLLSSDSSDTSLQGPQPYQASASPALLLGCGFCC